MRVKLYQSPEGEWFEKLPVSKAYPRHWITTVDLQIELSDGYVINAPSGTIWDGASIPKWAWVIFKPIDEAAIGDFIHDFLWGDKENQLERFGYNIFKARKFADTERKKWRQKLSKGKGIKNVVTHFVIRAVGGFFYSKEIEIPT